MSHRPEGSVGVRITQLPQGRTFDLGLLSRSSTIRDVKKSITRLIGLPLKEIRLLFEGAALEDEAQRLSEYEGTASRIALVLMMRRRPTRIPVRVALPGGGQLEVGVPPLANGMELVQAIAEAGAPFDLEDYSLVVGGVPGTALELHGRVRNFHASVGESRAVHSLNLARYFFFFATTPLHTAAEGKAALLHSYS